MPKVFQITHYAHCVNKGKYKNNPDGFYKTRVHEHETPHGTKIHDVQVRYSELDQDVNSDWREKTLVELVEDGNGLDLSLRERADSAPKDVRLNYSQALELLLALTKWHSLNQSGVMREVKIKR